MNGTSNGKLGMEATIELMLTGQTYIWHQYIIIESNYRGLSTTPKPQRNRLTYMQIQQMRGIM